MNLQENIRKVLREIEEDRIQIRLGRSAERHFGTVQNIIIQVDNEDITGQDGEPGLGKMNIVIKDGEIIVGDIFIPEKYRRQGIATQVYQKISDHFGLPIVNSKTKGFNQTMEGGYMWKDREKFEPRNLQESIRRILREESKNTSLQDKLLQVIKSMGIKRASKLVGGLEKLFSIIDLKGTKEDMTFLTKSIMENEVKEKLKYCNYIIVPSLHHITLYVYIPKPLPEHEGEWVHDQSVRYRAEELIGMLLSKLGGGLIRGHNIYVSNTGEC